MKKHKIRKMIRSYMTIATMWMTFVIVRFLLPVINPMVMVAGKWLAKNSGGPPVDKMSLAGCWFAVFVVCILSVLACFVCYVLLRYIGKMVWGENDE